MSLGESGPEHLADDRRVVVGQAVHAASGFPWSWRARVLVGQPPVERADRPAENVASDTEPVGQVGECDVLWRDLGKDAE